VKTSDDLNYDGNSLSNDDGDRMTAFAPRQSPDSLSWGLMLTVQHIKEEIRCGSGFRARYLSGWNPKYTTHQISLYQSAFSFPDGRRSYLALCVVDAQRAHPNPWDRKVGAGRGDRFPL
jgi:hypothetical protein